MLRIRLSRKGKKKQPQYRVVVADVKFKRDGRFVENIGYYNPLTDPPTVEIKEDRALHWLSVGAQPSDPVRHMLQKRGTFDRLKRLHQGEALEELVAEFTGIPVEAAVIEEEAVVEEAAVESAPVEEAPEAEPEETADADTPAEEAVEEAPEAETEAEEDSESEA
ncbi:MAG: 30S ribosomal protein S16 [Ardenticatenaceae bacterium]|nr:30S ribosomal protein S16 [Ardenticatenaceae bacterium]